jgi:NAD(P)-dependent dehydrogenase (short-subunit alcohol dehydrogenase family)
LGNKENNKPNKDEETVMAKLLENKVALVTGGTAGIGRAAAVALAKAGAKVVISGRRETEGNETLRLIKDAGSTGTFVKSDINIEKDVEALIKKTLDTYGRLDIAFNNAGILTNGLVVDSKADDFQKVFDVNVKGVLLSMKYEIPAMEKSGGGSIINNSSIAGIIGIPESSIYVASKHAVIGLTKSAALEVATKNIRINAVLPAGIETDMLEEYRDHNESEKFEAFKMLHPMHRFGTPEEIANVVVFLASPASSFITGQSIPIDGGFTTQ